MYISNKQFIKCWIKLKQCEKHALLASKGQLRKTELCHFSRSQVVRFASQI